MILYTPLQNKQKDKHRAPWIQYVLFAKSPFY